MPQQPSLLTSGGTQFQITPLAFGQNEPAIATLTVTAAAVIGATSLTATIVPANTKLYAGLVFKIGTIPNEQWVIVAETWNGTGTLKVEPLKRAITASAIAGTTAGLPVIGLEGANMQLQTEVNSVVLMSNNGWKISDYSTGSFEFSGNLYIPTTPDLTIGAYAVADALLKKQNMYVERILPNGTIHAGVCIVSNCSDQTQGAQYITQSVTFMGSGTPYQYRINAV